LKSDLFLRDFSVASAVVGYDEDPLELSETQWENVFNSNQATFFTNPKSTQPLVFEGNTSDAQPTRIVLQRVSEQKKVEYVSPGDSIRGPGIPFNTQVASVNSDYIELTKPVVRYGTYVFTVEIKKGRLPQDLAVLNFKTELKEIYGGTFSTQTPERFLWPSEQWPLVGRGYVEGIKDLSLYQYPASYPLALAALQDTLSGLLPKLFSRWSFEGLVVSSEIVDSVDIQNIGSISSEARKTIRTLSGNTVKYISLNAGGTASLVFASQTSTQFAINLKMFLEDLDHFTSTWRDILSWATDSHTYTIRVQAVPDVDPSLILSLDFQLDVDATTYDVSISVPSTFFSVDWHSYSFNFNFENDAFEVAVDELTPSSVAVATGLISLENTTGLTLGDPSTSFLAFDEVTLYHDVLSTEENAWLVANFQGIETTKHLSIPNPEFGGTVYLEMSLDRILLHKNFLGSTKSLIDLPWLDYLKSQAESFRRASEDVRVGVQLNMTTDLSGLFSITSDTTATDATTGVKFITFPTNYNKNNKVAYVRFGSGGQGSNDALFLSVGDLKKPPIYGPAVYGKDTYSAGVQQYSEEDLKISIPEDVDIPLFEVPIGVYEDLHDIQYKTKQNYHGIITTLIEERFRRLLLPLEGGINFFSPKLLVGSRAPSIEDDSSPTYGFNYKGKWVPEIDSIEVGVTPAPKYPEDPAERDYYDVEGEGVFLDDLGDEVLIPRDSGLVYLNSEWVIKPWKSLGPFTLADGVAFPTKIDLHDKLVDLALIIDGGTGEPKETLTDLEISELCDQYFFYFILTGDGWVDPSNKKGSWLVLRDYNVLTSLLWEIKPLETISILTADLDLSIFDVNSPDREELATFKKVAVKDYSADISLPRRFLTQGSVEALIKIDPLLEAVPVGEIDPVNITGSPFYWDETEYKYYVLDADDGVTKHYMDFKDPKYFKNLSELIGFVDVNSPNVLAFYDDEIPFPYSEVALTSMAKRIKELDVRYKYDRTQEFKVFKRNVELIAQLDTVNNDRVTTIQSTPRFEEHQASWDAITAELSVGDQATAIVPYQRREEGFDNLYFRDFLIVAGSVYADDPAAIKPLFNTPESQVTLLQAMKYLQKGDTLRHVYIFENGITYSTLASNWNSSGSFMRVLLPPTTDTGYWVAAGESRTVSITSNPMSSWTPGQITLTDSEAPANTEFVSGVAAPENTGLGVFLGGSNATLLQYQPSGAMGSNLFRDTSIGLTGTDVVSHIFWDVSIGGLVFATLEGVVKYSAYDSAVGNPDFTWIQSHLPTDVDQGGGSVVVGFHPISGNTPIDAFAFSPSTYAIAGYRADFTDPNPGDGQYDGPLSVIFTALDIFDPDDGLGGTLTDGSQWEIRELPTGWPDGARILAMTYADGRWVIAGEQGTIAISTDDLASSSIITLPSALASVDITKVVFADGLWTFIGEDTTGYVATTYDFSEWNIPVEGTTVVYRTVAADSGGRFVLGGDSVSTQVSQYLTNTPQELYLAGKFANGDVRLQLTADLPGLDFTDIDRHTVLLAIDTQQSVEYGLQGIPESALSRFVNNYDNQLFIPQYEQVNSWGRATRVHFPRQTSTLESTQGYPTYEEDPTLYEDTDFLNAAGVPVSLADASGRLLDENNDVITPLNYVNVERDSVDFDDPKVISRTPKYFYLQDWLVNGGDLVQVGGVQDMGNITITDIDPVNRIITFNTTLPTATLNYLSTNGWDAFRLIINPEVSALPYEQVLDGALVFEIDGNGDRVLNGTDHVLAQEYGAVTTVHIPFKGYGGFEGADPSLAPWENDPSVFHDATTLVKNYYGDQVYLADETGAKILDGSSQPIPLRSPKYSTWIDVIISEGRLIEREGASWEDIDVTVKTFNSAVIVFEDDLVDPTTFGSGETIREFRVLMLNPSTVPFETYVNRRDDLNYVYPLELSEIALFPPDRVSYESTTYPTIEESPEMYQPTLTYRNSNKRPILECNDQGQYIYTDGQGVRSTAGLPGQRFTLPKMKYPSNQDWYTKEFHIEGGESNPYWIYIKIKDVFDIPTAKWTQKIEIVRPEKRKNQIEYKRVKDPSFPFFSVTPGVRLEETSDAINVLEDVVIDYADGRLSMFLIMNEDWQQQFRYGLEVNPTFDVNAFSTSTLQETTLPADIEVSYIVNSKRNVADSQDQIAPIVGLTELGVYNTDNDMIAYAVFPPIIYNSAKHHVSFNMFIKNGLFGSAQAT
jgi:hypothetical protein